MKTLKSSLSPDLLLKTPKSYLNILLLKYKIIYKGFVADSISTEHEYDGHGDLKVPRPEYLYLIDDFQNFLDQAEFFRGKVLSIIRKDKSYVYNASEFCRQASEQINKIEREVYVQLRHKVEEK